MSDVSITSLSGSVLNPFIGSWLILTNNIIYSTALVLALPYLEMLFLSRLLRRWRLSSPFSVVAPSPFSGNWTRIIYFGEYHGSHGGRIWAENRKDKTRSTFIFILPKVNEDLAGGARENLR
jgi:hypothetical protein